MKAFLLIWVPVFVAAFVALMLVDAATLPRLYDKMQMPLFTGFLTIGSFLLTLKTFILLKLKEGIYDSPSYQARFQELRGLNDKLTLYGPLTRLGRFLIYCVLSAFTSAVAQVTLGLLEAQWALAICLSFAAATGILVLVAWWHIKQNLDHWFDLMESQAKTAQHN